MNSHDGGRYQARRVVAAAQSPRRSHR